MNRSTAHDWHGGKVPPGRPIIVGVVPGHRPLVVREAGGLAQLIGVGLICVWADASRLSVGEASDGAFDTTPLDPDQDDDGTMSDAEAEMDRRLGLDLTGIEIPWLFVYTVGETARALTTVAVRHDARLIAVGGRRPGLAGWMNELVGGSVAGRLAHTQRRPVLVIPAAPRPGG